MSYTKYLKCTLNILHINVYLKSSLHFHNNEISPELEELLEAALHNLLQTEKKNDMNKDEHLRNILRKLKLIQITVSVTPAQNPAPATPPPISTLPASPQPRSHVLIASTCHDHIQTSHSLHSVSGLFGLKT